MKYHHQRKRKILVTYPWFYKEWLQMKSHTGVRFCTSKTFCIPSCEPSDSNKSCNRLPVFWTNHSNKTLTKRVHSVLTRDPALHLFPDYFITITAKISRIKQAASKRKEKKSCNVTHLCTRAAGPCRSSPSRRRSRTDPCVCHTCSSPSRHSSLGLRRTVTSIGPGRPGRSPRWAGLRTEDSQRHRGKHLFT